MTAHRASGLSDLDIGVRLRYEISRKFAPYIGFAKSDYCFAFGLRLWF